MNMLLYCPSTGKVREEPVRVPQGDEVVWIRMQDPKPEEVKQVLGTEFDCHPLLVEDAVMLNQRPKMDKYKNNFFLTFFAVTKSLKPVEIGIVIGENYVITVCKEELTVLDHLYRDCKEIEGRMSHPGVMLHALLDHCVDDYTDIVDHIESRVEKMERGIYKNPYMKIAQEVFQLKRTLHKLRRTIIEERAILGTISHQSFPYTKQEDDVYFIDIFDHISRVVDSLDIFRESLTGLLELQMSMKSDRMNEIMKTLTLFSSIFLPLTFIVGLYGMNFKFMPEFEWHYGYVYVLLLLIVVGGSTWIYFKKKRWF
ncbi:magnesium/cobalt transporter CorA [Paenibacillus eucommiae]|uniref:Magnesium transport protein CorA n=1 Tax=Paenibacillus eucommiae TaxID=1355755 RepID=A0ABS4J2U4_9BACL|nr:magnesium/cobalt transporter CorA [Paenibacillus eucommiae]MBP1993134.1 magnesium transporter [Paenibacillus eucommiae]